MCSAPPRPEGDRINVAAAFGMTHVFLKLILDTRRTMSYISPVPSAGGRSREASLGWDGSGACGRRGTGPPGSGGQGQFGGPRVSEDHRRLIRPPRTTAGAPWRAGSGAGDGRTRPTSPGLKPRARPGSGAETRPPTSRGGPWSETAARDARTLASYKN